MSEPKWTPAQRAAIEDRGGALLVSAAAGSGKTAVLTERAVRLITDPDHPVDADKLLIVTFTNAAAAELRARIGQALLRLSQQQPHNTSLRRQRMLLQRAPICTIDAFCLDLLHKHFQALDIPPDFAPADPGSVEVLRASALSETLENAYRDPDFCAFADLYGKGRTDQAAGNTILHVYDFLRALPDYDRADALREEYARLGIAIDLPDENRMLVRGGAIRPAEVWSHGDHRIAMSLAVAALRCTGGSVTLRDAEVVSKSYPGFYEALDALRIQA